LHDPKLHQLRAHPVQRENRLLRLLVLSVEEVARDPHWLASGAFEEYVHPGRGPTCQLRPIGPPRTRRGPPPDSSAGASDRTLRTFGFLDQDIRAFKKGGIVSERSQFD